MRRGLGTSLVVGVATLSLIVLPACGGKKKKSGTSKKADATTSIPAQMSIGPSTVGEGPNVVLFEASGSGTADIAYGVTDYQAQDNQVKLPWQKTVRTQQVPGTASMMVVGQEQGASCKLTINGKVIQEAKAEAGQTMVTCRTS